MTNQSPPKDEYNDEPKLDELLDDPIMSLIQHVDGYEYLSLESALDSNATIQAA